MVTRLHVKPHKHDSSRRQADPVTSETFSVCWASRLPHSYGTAVPPLPRLLVYCITSSEERPSRWTRIYSRMNELHWRQNKNFIVLLSRTLFCPPFFKNKDRKNDFRTRSINREEAQRSLWYGELECFWNILVIVSVNLICPVFSRENAGRYVTLLYKGLLAFSCQVCIIFLFINSVLTGELEWWWIWSQWQLFKIKLNKPLATVGGGNMVAVLVCSADTKSPEVI